MIVRVVVAGTFGPLHDGHRALLTEALRQGDEGVVVGLTSDSFANSTRERSVPPFDARKDVLATEMEALNEWNRTIEITEINDKFGMAITDPTLDAVVVSTETVDEVDSLNDKREKRGLSPLSPIVVPLVEAEDGDRISSTRIAHGDITEHGERT